MAQLKFELISQLKTEKIDRCHAIVPSAALLKTNSGWFLFLSSVRTFTVVAYKVDKNKALKTLSCFGLVQRIGAVSANNNRQTNKTTQVGTGPLMCNCQEYYFLFWQLTIYFCMLVKNWEKQVIIYSIVDPCQTLTCYHKTCKVGKRKRACKVSHFGSWVGAC